jgi:tRNA A37 methylthiotransferase MiaB
MVFPYDNKEGTIAAEIPGKVPQRIINTRMREAFRHFRKVGVQAYYSCPP